MTLIVQCNKNGSFLLHWILHFSSLKAKTFGHSSFYYPPIFLCFISGKISLLHLWYSRRGEFFLILFLYLKNGSVHWCTHVKCRIVIDFSDGHLFGRPRAPATAVGDVGEQGGPRLVLADLRPGGEGTSGLNPSSLLLLAAGRWGDRHWKRELGAFERFP